MGGPETARDSKIGGFYSWVKPYLLGSFRRNGQRTAQSANSLRFDYTDALWGVYLLHRFLTRIGFKRALGQGLHIAQRNNRYSAGEMLLALLYPMVLGLERIETTQLLRQNGVFQYLTGLPSYPDATSLRRFLLRIAPTTLPKLRALHERFLHRFTVRPRPPTRSKTCRTASWVTARARELGSGRSCAQSRDSPPFLGLAAR